MKKWITKAEEKQILRSYERYKGEFQPVEGIEHVYEIPGIRRAGQIASIFFEKEPKPILPDNPRVFVHHPDGNGIRMFTDVWERDKEGKFIWKYRNSVNEPISDRMVIIDYEKQIESLKLENNRLKQRLRLMEESDG